VLAIPVSTVASESVDCFQKQLRLLIVHKTSCGINIKVHQIELQEAMNDVENMEIESGKTSSNE
jgi:hypothetical protein